MTKRQRRCGTFAILTTLIFLRAACPTFEPPPPHPLGAPVLQRAVLSEFYTGEEFEEAAYLQWTPPQNDSLSVRSYTMLRKRKTDSLFDILSHGIPGDTLRYYDRLSEISFPHDSYDTIFYRIFAFDSLGRSSDTSSACTLILASQPTFVQFNSGTGVFRWSSSMAIQAPIDSWIKVWNLQRTFLWQSRKFTDYANVTAFFEATIPDSLLPPPEGELFYGLFLEANGRERQSLKIGSIMIP